MATRLRAPGSSSIFRRGEAPSSGRVVSPSSLPPGYLLGVGGFYRPERRNLLYANRRWDAPLQSRVLAWLRDNVDDSIPRRYYQAVLGHDLHLSVWAELYVRMFRPHIGKHTCHPLCCLWEDVGLVSRGKVTTAFRDFEAACLVTDQTTYGDFKYHEVGTSNTAENNTQTSLVASTGIARVAGTQSNPSVFTYQTVATILADSTETWQEHGIFNTSGGGAVMIDRSVLSPTINVMAGDTIEFTYILTKNAEP